MGRHSSGKPDGCVVRMGGGTHCRDLEDLGAGGQVAGAEQMSD